MVAWVCLDLLRTGKATAVGAATGLVVGLVGITPAAGYITVPALTGRGRSGGARELHRHPDPRENEAR